MVKILDDLKIETDLDHRSMNDNFEKTGVKIVRLKWVILKLFVLSIFILLFFVAISTKLLRQILYGVICGLDYLTKLGSDDIDGKITRLFERIKKVGRDFNKI